MAILHLMIGLPCSGKTTRARALARETNAIVFTPDKWHLRLFGDDVCDTEHDIRHAQIEAIMWETAEELLARGVDVILDFGCWAREERDAARQRAKALGASFQLHYMDVPVDELFRRLAIRNRERRPGVFVIPEEMMASYIGVFQPPSEEELQA